MLPAADRIDEKASGFELGADDYHTKPFELQELGLRLRALDLRRAQSRPLVREIASLGLDPFRREEYRNPSPATAWAPTPDWQSSKALTRLTEEPSPSLSAPPGALRFGVAPGRATAHRQMTR